MAEREGFEPPVPLRVHLISSQARSTGLRHLSLPKVPPILRRVTVLAGNSSSTSRGSYAVTGVTVLVIQVPLTKVGGSRSVPAAMGAIQVGPGLYQTAFQTAQRVYQ